MIQVTSSTGLPSIGLCKPRHLWHLKFGMSTSLRFIPLHFLRRTYASQLVQKIEFLPIAFLHTLHGYFPDCFIVAKPFPQIIFIFPMFTRNPLFFILSFHNFNFFINRSSFQLLTRDHQDEEVLKDNLYKIL